MTAPELECCKCHAPMHPGYLLEEGHANERSITAWVEGQPQKSFWMGLKTPREKLATRTYRCTNCGYLESYAPAATA